MVVDSQEAGSLSHNRNNIHVYSNSWGPYDDGYTVQGPGLLLNEAFINGVDQVLRIKLMYIKSVKLVLSRRLTKITSVHVMYCTIVVVN